MKRRRTKQAAALALSAAMLATTMAGCGSKASSDGTESSNAKYPKTLTVDVFDSQANFQGIQTGWFAKIVKDKFNIELNIIAPNVAGGGDTLYQTRSANGNLGDIIITNLDSSRLKDMVTAGLVLDMTDYLDGCENLNKYKTAIEDASDLADSKGMWAVPSEISNQPGTEPCEASEPTNAPSLRWDLYKEAGYPEMNTMEDLIPVLSQMQEIARKDDSSAYAFSLFKDWDGDIMQNAGGLCALYGYEPMGFAMMKDDGSDIQSVIDDDGIYVRSLKLLFDANQQGLVDPESTTQDFDTLQTKYQNGQVLYSLWPWLGAGKYNTTENTAAGKGFASAQIKDMKCLSYGSMPQGKMSLGIMVGSQTEDPQRMVDFVDWLYSPEGIMASANQTGGTCGPEGLTWTNDNGTPKLTDFGVKAFVDMDSDLKVPDEWGGGSWKDGVSALNYKAVGVVDVDESTGICYNYQRWDDYLTRVATPLTEDWSAANEGAATAIDRFEATDNLLVLPGTNYATPEYTTDISTVKEQCKQTIVQYSWQMVFASDEKEFNSLLKTMQDTVKGLGYDDVFAVDKSNCEDRGSLIKAALAE
ncbi:ABC transporter substrate-binding protein [Agathobacter sp.]